MEKDDSIVYVGCSFILKRRYYGLVHNRVPQGRWQEHLRALLQHGSGMSIEREQNYSYMAHNGGAAKWCFLPTLPGPVDRRFLF